MGYQIKRVDANQRDLVKVFRDNGCLVLILSTVGHGCPDILVGIPDSKALRLVEIKDGSKPKSAQKLTQDEEKFHALWRSHVKVIASPSEALELIREMRNERVIRWDIEEGV